MKSSLSTLYSIAEVSFELELFVSVAFGPVSSLDFEKLSGFNRAGHRSKSRFPLNDRVFAIAGIKQRKQLVATIALSRRCDCFWVKLIFIFIKISSKFEVIFLISSLNRAQTG